MAPVTTADARRTALTGLIDDAGLFPPARLPLPDAVATHRRNRARPEAWMVARFVCPASQLGALAALLEAGERFAVAVTLDLDTSLPWSDGLGASLAQVDAADERLNVQLVELRLMGDDLAEAVSAVVAALDAGLAARVVPCLEVPRADSPPERDRWPAMLDAALAAMASAREQGSLRHGAPRMKIRTGGLEPAAFPTPDELALLVVACRDHGVPFKATAGLHHPVRHTEAATGLPMHGFLNLLGGAAFALDRGLTAGEVAEVIAEEDPTAFSLEPDRLRWRHAEAGTAVIARARAELFTSQGSCDVDEPVTDLRALGVLPA